MSAAGGILGSALRRWTRWWRPARRRRRRDDRGAAATRTATGLSALVVMGTITYVATGCGDLPFGSTGGATGSPVAASSVPGGIVQPTVSDHNVATINAHGEGGNNGTTAIPLDIPEDVYQAQLRAAEAYDFPWEIIAAVAARETHNGTWDGPGVTPGSRNSAGAAGILQFGVADPDTGAVGAAANAWGGMPVERVEDRARHYEVGEMPSSTDIWDYFGIDGNGDGVVDVWDPWDNIVSGTFKLAYMSHLAANHQQSTVARDCRSNGFPDPIDCAIYRHNPAGWYVAQVRELAELYVDSEYAVTPALNVTPASFLTGADGQDCADIDVASQGVWGLGGVSDVHRAAVEFVIEQEGDLYSQDARYGPDSYDCSGLMYVAYKSAGVDIPTVTWTQWEPDDPGYRDTQAVRVQDGGSLDVDTLQPGDMVFFHTIPDAEFPSHVGMYIGNGEMVDAGNEEVGVRRGPIDADYWHRHFVGVVRIVAPDTDVMVG